MEITRSDYLNMAQRYRELVVQLPPHVSFYLPEALSKFLSPANMTPFGYDVHTSELSITGVQRWQMLLSPHALTMLRAYAHQMQAREAWFSANPKAPWWEAPR